MTSMEDNPMKDDPMKDDPMKDEHSTRSDTYELLGLNSFTNSEFLLTLGIQFKIQIYISIKLNE